MKTRNFTLTNEEINLLKVSVPNGIDFLHYSIDCLCEKHNVTPIEVLEAYVMKTNFKL